MANACALNYDVAYKFDRSIYGPSTLYMIV